MADNMKELSTDMLVASKSNTRKATITAELDTPWSVLKSSEELTVLLKLPWEYVDFCTLVPQLKLSIWKKTLFPSIAKVPTI